MTHPRVIHSRLSVPARRGARALAVLCVAVVATAGGCRATETSGDARAGTPAAAKAPPLPDRFGLGQPASSAQLAAINIDANGSGVGLPAGRGTYAEGAALYAQRCASCHGSSGQGQGPYPRLIGAEPRDSFPFGNDVKLDKTIGNYWPYATTLYDYIHRAMPYNAPGSLTPNEVYAVVAYLLAENQVVPRTAVIDATSLPRIKMPAHDHFVPDDRTGGPAFR